MATLSTQNRQVEEIIKCGKDSVYFINNWVKIQHPKRGLISFNTYDFQDNCLRLFETHDYNIVVKARQLGLSTVTAAYALWMALFRQDKNILIVATKLKTAVSFLKKVKTMLSHLPKWIMLTSPVAMNKTEIEFDNGSVITAIATGEDAARGEALSLLIVDEAAIIRELETLWAGLFPTVSEGGKVILISTPFGVGGFYHKTWIEAEAGLNSFNPIKLTWDVHPERDELWFAKVTRNMSAKKIAQEYTCSFLSSGETFIQSEDMDYLLSTISSPITKEGPNQNIWIWRPPEENMSYVIAADVARGDSSDYSAFHIINADTCEIVAEFKGLIPPDKLAELMIEYGRQYNNALLCPEKNSFGYSTAIKLRDSNYENLYYEKERVDIYTQVEETAIPGFTTQVKSRLQILTKLEELIRNKVLIAHSKRLYDEVTTFVWSGGKAQSLKGAHDDLIMSLAIGLWIMDIGSAKINDNVSRSAAVIQAISVDRRDYRQYNSNFQDLHNTTPLITPQIKFGATMAGRENDSKLINEISGKNFDWLLR